MLEAGAQISLPHLPQELWTEALKKTDLWTCLTWSNCVAAQTFLSANTKQRTRQLKAAAVMEAASIGNVVHLSLLLCNMRIPEPPDLMVVAVWKGHRGTIEWLKDNDKGVCTFETLKVAFNYGEDGLICLLDEINEARSNNVFLSFFVTAASSYSVQFSPVFFSINSDSNSGSESTL